MTERKCYQTKAFAAAAGVSIKTLHHYDRLGLLTPTRTAGGYREYSESDFERLELIASLKFLGFGLKEIATVLQAGPEAVFDALRRQREALDERIANLDAARRAIDQYVGSIDSRLAENSRLTGLVNAARLKADARSMERYYDAAGWERHKRFYEEGPSDEWRALYADIAALIDGSDDGNHDPGSPEAQAVAERWLNLSMRAYAGDPQVQTDSPVAWMNRARWPAGLKRRAARLRLQEVHDFIREAAQCAARKYFSTDAWKRLERQRDRTPEEISRLWQARVDLFRDIEAAQTRHPTRDEEQAFADRWRLQIEQASGGDADIKAGLLRTWADRANWPAVLRWRYEALAMMAGERFDRAADCLDRVIKDQTTTGRRQEL